MKQIKFQKLFLTLIIFSILFTTSCSDSDNGGGDPPPAKKGKVTFIYYSQVDINIAPEAYNQLKELSSSCNAEYRAVAMFNFPETYRTIMAKELKLDAVGTLQLYMAGDKTYKLLSNSGSALTDMSTPETFTAFINKAAKLYPAEEYVIIFNGHGLGWEYLQDGTRSTPSGEATMKGLTVTGISNSIKSSVINGKVKMIDFESCLMAGYEYLGDLAQHTSYIIGTPTLSYATGEKVEKLVTLIKSTSDWDVVSKSMASYLAECYDELWAVSVAIKTEGASELFAKIKQFNTQLNSISLTDEAKRQAIIEAATSTFRFSKKDEEEDEEEEQTAHAKFVDSVWTSDECSLADFYYRAKAVDPSLSQPYDDFVAALNKVVIASKSSTQISASGLLAKGNTHCGLSMLFFAKNTYEKMIKGTSYKDLVFTKETDPEKLFSIFFK